MRWIDILTIQKSDYELIRHAPDYFKDKMYGTRSYSYLGLLHASVFADVQNCYQKPNGKFPIKWNQRTTDLVTHNRTGMSQMLQDYTVRGAIPFTILAIISVIFLLILSAFYLTSNYRLINNEILVLTLLSSGFYSTVFFSLHRLQDPYTPGFWLPRLVLPSVCIFYSLGFVFIDKILFVKVSQTTSKAVGLLLLYYTIAISCCILGFFV